MSLDTFALSHGRSSRGTHASRRPSTLVNRNVTVAGHRTSVRLEPAMWDALHYVCEREQKPLNRMVTEIAQAQAQSSLTAAIRVYLMSYFRAAAMRFDVDRLHRQP